MSLVALLSITPTGVVSKKLSGLLSRPCISKLCNLSPAIDPPLEITNALMARNTTKAIAKYKYI